MKLQRKYFVIFFLLFIAISLVITFIAYYLSHYILIKKYEQLRSENLNYILEITDKELEQLNSTFEFIANNTVVLKRIETDYNDKGDYEKLKDDEDVTNTFSAMRTFDIFKSIQAIYMCGNNGEEYWYGFGNDFDEKTRIENRLRKTNFNVNKLTYLGTEESYYKLLRHKKVLKFTRKLYNQYGKEIGLVYIELDANYFKNLFSYEKISNYTELYLVDANRNLIYNNSKENLGIKFNEDKIQGVRVKEYLSSYDWSLISITPENQILDDSKLIIHVTLFTAFISIVLELFLVMIITGQIVKPIKKLTDAMNKVKSGNLNIQIDYISNDEIGILTDNFNSMTRELKNNLKKEIDNQKAINDAEYKALQAQINPHFMYNSLNALKWLANIQGADNIIEVVNALWTLLKMTSGIKGQFVELKSEIKIIDAYSKIQQIRYKGKFEIVYDIEENHMSKIVPKYILQPFVENSIFHGIEPKKGFGTIYVSTQIINNELIIKVIDNGVGMSKKVINRILAKDSVTDKGRGLNDIGVKNVDQRLKLLYGEEYGIRIESEINKGTTIILKIPTQRKIKGVD